MKLLNIILLSSILIFSSCSKDEDSSPSNSNNNSNNNTGITTNTETTNGHAGSYTMTVNGKTFTNLQDDISLINSTLQIPGLDNAGLGFVFNVFGGVGAIGETRNICLDDDVCNVVIASGLMLEEANGANNFNATSGTITRVSQFVVNINLTQDLGNGVKTLTATVNIGTIITI